MAEAKAMKIILGFKRNRRNFRFRCRYLYYKYADLGKIDSASYFYVCLV